MRLGRASALGVFAVTHIADITLEDEHYYQGKAVAKDLGVPLDYLLKILQQLVRAGILKSIRGPQGGFQLQIPASKITLLSIVEAIDGQIDGKLEIRNEVKGRRKAKRGIESACGEAARQARTLLGGTSIRDLMEKPRE